MLRNSSLGWLLNEIESFICSIYHRSDSWQLAMNINPCDGHNFGYGGPWTNDRGYVVGSKDEAMIRDFREGRIWAIPVGYITITRHVNGTCQMFKTWELKNKDKSMNQYFYSYPGRIYATGDGSVDDQPKRSYIPDSFDGQSTDPIFGADGGLVFNWYHGSGGARIAVTGGYKIPYTLPGTSEHNADLHGLGNEFYATTSKGQGSTTNWHDAAQLSGDCGGSNCPMVGTDHGTSLWDGPCWGKLTVYFSYNLLSDSIYLWKCVTVLTGSYAIYVSDTDTPFQCS